MLLIVLSVFLLLTVLCYKVVKIYDYWINKGVKQRKQVYLFGDNAGTIFKRETFFDAVIKMYNAFPEERYIGVYQMTLPTLLIRDPELIKQITVKEFDHFSDHRQLISEDVDPMWSKNLVALKGNKWRRMRATVSPSFTSRKMRIIFNLISEFVDNYVDYFKKPEKVETIELKDVFTRYTNDVIATVAFGIHCDSIHEKSNEFYVKGREATTYTFNRFLVYALMPRLSKFLRMKLFPEMVSNFFANLVVNNIKIREEKNIVRPDMIHLLLQAKKGKMRKEDEPGVSTVEGIIKDKPKQFEITDMDIAVQALTFFFAGFESVSSALCFIGYELTVNPDIQKKLQEEIDETMKICNGKLTYEALMKMKYMDMVVSEGLRKWPPAVITDRVCTRTFTIEPSTPNERPLTLEPGETLWIPIVPIHRDPKYYPNPDKFDPERFSDENKRNIKPYTYLPFGLGPRNCIGSRFALMEIKTILFDLLGNFDFVVVDRTDIPLKLSKTSFNLLAENGMWIGLKSRKV